MPLFFTVYQICLKYLLIYIFLVDFVLMDKSSYPRKLKRLADSMLASSDIQDFQLDDVSGNTDDHTDSVCMAASSYNIPDFQLNYVDDDVSCEDSCSSSNTSDLPDKIPQEYIREWAVNCNVPGQTVQKLLDSIHCFDKLNLFDLPKTTAFLQGKKISVDKISDIYHYYGIEGFIRTMIENSQQVELEISINVDGISFFKSSPDQAWVISGMIEQLSMEPFVIAVHYDKKKPEVHAFLRPLVDELLLLQTGRLINSTAVTVKVKRFVCDAPALSLIKMSKGHTGYNSCFHCNDIGSYSYTGRTVVFSVTEGQMRSNSSFRDRSDQGHHLGTSPLEELEIDMIETFPRDPMHLLYLGVQKRLLKFWSSKLAGSHAISQAIQSQISDRHCTIGQHFPSEFVRQPRPFSTMPYWKAVEYMTFALFTGLLALKGLVSTAVYHNFLLFHFSIFVYSKEWLQDYHSVAQRAMKSFVSNSSEIYGDHFISHNVHSCLHILHDCVTHGALHNFSAFKFENLLQILKNRVRSGNKPLSQCDKIVSMRLNRGAAADQASYYDSKPRVVTLFPECVRARLNESHKILNFIVRKGIRYGSQERDSCVITKNKRPMLIQYIIQQGNKILFACRPFSVLEDLYVYPEQSSKFGVYCVGSPVDSRYVFISLDDILSKCCYIPIPGTKKKAVIPFSCNFK